MSRERFGKWGASLAPEEFAQALAAAGVLYADRPPGRFRNGPPGRPGAELDPGPVADQLVKSLDRAEPTPWKISKRHGRGGAAADAAALAAAWRDAVRRIHRTRDDRELRGAVRLALHVDRADPDAGWLVRELSRPATEADGISIHEPGEAVVRWTWPLQVGCLAGGESELLCQALRSTRYGESLASVRTLRPGGDPCDLLVLPYSLREATRRVLAEVPRVGAAAVAVLGGTLEPWPRTAALAAMLRQESGAGAVFVAAVPPATWAEWFTRLIENLSHDAPLDVALGRSGDENPERLLFATPAVLDEARLRSVVVRMGERLAAAPPELEVHLPPMLEYATGLEGEASRSAPMVGGAILANVSKMAFDSERGEAAAFAEMALSLEAAAAAEPAARTDTPRYLQAQVLAPDGKGTRQVTDAFRPGEVHHVDVFVGVPRDGWLSPGKDAAFPDNLLPHNGAGHALRVVFSEQLHLERPQTATIHLPVAGGSSTCRFTFVARGDRDEVEARIAVLYENRVLQTALLRGPVAGQDGANRPDARITMALEGVVHPEMAGLDERSHFHAALVVNRNADGESRVMAAAGESVAVMGLEGMQQGLKAIRDRLSSTPPTRVGPTENPFGPDVVKLLQFMAYHGRELHDGLLRNNDFSGMLRPATRMQIISAKAESFLPLEFCYDRPSPAVDAGMCPNALEAARTGECEACAAQAHLSEAPYICPAGFWALTRVIERHAFDPRTRPKDGAEFTLFNVPAPTRERRELQPLRSALYAASNRVDAAKGKKKGEGLIQRVLEGLTRAVSGAGGTASLAPSWAAWKEEVKSRSPTLLVVLSHTATNRDLKAVGLEIAEGDCLLSGHISPAHVAHRATPQSPPSTTPVVLLLGCETIAPEIPYQGFVPAFRDAGAAAVICTNSTVLGREVGPAAEQLVRILEEITRSPEPVALGDALLRLRRECFASGMPMALGLVAYGDADWRLTR